MELKKIEDEWYKPDFDPGSVYPKEFVIINNVTEVFDSIDEYAIKLAKESIKVDKLYL